MPDVLLTAIWAQLSSESSPLDAVAIGGAPDLPVAAGEHVAVLPADPCAPMTEPELLPATTGAARTEPDVPGLLASNALPSTPPVGVSSEMPL